MDDRERKILDDFLKFVRDSDQETKERMLCFCEGVSVGATMKEKEEKTA